MAVTLADRLHSGDDPRRMNLLIIMLGFGAIISATFFRNRGNTPKGPNPHTYQDRKTDEGEQMFERPKNCTYTVGNKTKE